MWLAEAPICDFVSFDPDFPPHAQIVIIEVQRDDRYIDDLMVAVAKFDEEVEAEIKFVREYKSLA